MDAIQKAYLKSKEKNKLPIISCGKYDIDDLEESFDAYNLIKDSDFVMPNDHHEKTIRDYLKNVAPEDLTMEHHENVRKIIQTHPENLPKRILSSTYLGPIHKALAKYPKKISGDELILDRSVIQKAIDHGLRANTGRTFSSQGLAYQHNKETGEFQPVEHAYNSSLFFGSATDDHPFKMNETAHHDLLDLHTKHILDHEASSDIHKYTEDSKHINKDLVDAHVGNRKPMWSTDGISHAINTAPRYNKEFDVYSGLSKSANIMKETEDGTKEAKFHAPAFMSTSLDFNTAIHFVKPKIDAMREFHVDSKEEHEDGDLLHMTIPAGFKGGLYVDGHTDHPGEREFLLDKGHNFTIHPNPKYVMHHGKYVRIWKATVQPKDQ